VTRPTPKPRDNQSRSNPSRPPRPPKPERMAKQRPRKRFGQHFLERAWVDKLVALVSAQATDTFLEIGPGHGALTLPLAVSGAPIRAVEIDRDLAADLKSTAPANVTVIEGDVLAMPPADLFPADAQNIRVVGNLPYNVSSPILFRLLQLWRETHRLLDATLMLQREVAVRIAATPGNGDYGPLSILTALHADVDTLLQLPPGAFRPPPKVHSSVIRLRFRPPTIDVDEYAIFERLVRTLFQQRRKTVANALKPLLPPTAIADTILRAADIDPRRRPETLSLQELAALNRALA
jgi:16S rRNA (adenine1518-N6/adenine1519-N6)-dimethyltransferase